MNSKALEWRMTSWEDGLRLANALGENWLFRGQGDANWPLTTSLERYPKAAGPESVISWHAEWIMLRELKRNGHLVVGRLPSGMTDLDWLALLQHHGGVTRLLDLTRSLYVAAFFALESTDTDAAVWAFDQRYMQNWFRRQASDGELESIPDLAQTLGDTASHLDSVNSGAILLANHLIGSPNERLGAVAVVPSLGNERITAQQGLFLFSLNRASSLEASLCHVLGIDDCSRLPMEGVADGTSLLDKLRDAVKPIYPAVVKVVIPVDLRLRILHDLRRMNITAASLFPGVDGFARSLNCYATGYRAMDQEGTA